LNEQITGKKQREYLAALTTTLRANVKKNAKLESDFNVLKDQYPKLENLRGEDFTDYLNRLFFMLMDNGVSVPTPPRTPISNSSNGSASRPTSAAPRPTSGRSRGVQAPAGRGRGRGRGGGREIGAGEVPPREGGTINKISSKKKLHKGGRNNKKTLKKKVKLNKY